MGNDDIFLNGPFSIAILVYALLYLYLGLQNATSLPCNEKGEFLLHPKKV